MAPTLCRGAICLLILLGLDVKTRTVVVGVVLVGLVLVVVERCPSSSRTEALLVVRRASMC